MKVLRVVVLLTILLISLKSSSADRILFLLPIASKSHVHVFEPLIRALGERGHEIVNLSPIKSPNMPDSVKQVQIYSVEEMFGEMANPFEMRKMGNLKSFVNGSFSNLLRTCDSLSRTDTFQNLVTKESFDLVIVDILMNYCVLGAVPLLKAPSILVSTMAAPRYLAEDMGNRLPYSFVADAMLHFTHKMSFLQRMQNVVMGGLMELVVHYMFLGPGEAAYKKNLPNGKNLPGIHEIQRNSSMVFMNSHFTLTYPRPLLPDVIEVGGMHCKPASSLPKDIDDFLTGSGEEGFIFFSLGSIVPAKAMPEEFRRIFIRVFSKLKQRVIWKWETESMPDVPPNVFLKKWCPQQDILGHPNIKLFMTHGGLLSTQEAAYHGVPLFGIPIFGMTHADFASDQDLNIKQAEATGYAKFFEILDISEEKLEAAIKDMLNNPKYMKKAKELAVVVRDLPQTPLEKAVYWTEYVLRHKGAPHLRSAARDLNFFQYYVLDVALALLVLVSVILLTLYAMLRGCCRLCFRKSGKGKQTKVGVRKKGQ